MPKDNGIDIQIVVTRKYPYVEVFWTAFKVGAWAAFAFLIILSSLLIPTSIEACCNPEIAKQYVSRVCACVAFLGFYFWLLILRKISSKKFRLTVSILSILIFVSCGLLLNTGVTKQRVYKLEIDWSLALPDDVKLKFFDSHVLGFVDQDTYKYYVLAFKSKWGDKINFLNNRFAYNTEQMRYIEFPKERNATGFRLVFQQLLKESVFNLPNKARPKWDENFKWGMLINGNKILLGVYYPNSMRLILFEHGFSN